MEAKTQRILELTASEKRKLQHAILGYGKLKAASEASSIHPHIIRNAARLGHAKPETIQKLRSTILA
jgi:hypothetical protein